MSLETVNLSLQNKDMNSAIHVCLQNNLSNLASFLGTNFKKDVHEPKTEESPEEIKYKVKLLPSWTTSENLAKLWNKMSRGNYSWRGIQLTWGDDADFFVVINCPPIGIFPDFKKVIFFQMEPNMHLHPEFWGEFANPDEKYFFKLCTHMREYNNVEWHLSKTYYQLKNEVIIKNPKLDNVVSTVLSEKYKDPGQMLRVDFVKFLEKNLVPVHVYGNNKWFYKDYKGSLPYHEKDNALFPYKYTFNAENNSIKNYFTEKIVDAILSECLCFYNGCFNLFEFLPKDAFVYLELSDFNKDMTTIQTAIRENWYEKRLPAIREAKRIILEELAFFPRLHKILNST